jgi:hypothetical protein
MTLEGSSVVNPTKNVGRRSAHTNCANLRLLFSVVEIVIGGSDNGKI